MPLITATEAIKRLRPYLPDIGARIKGRDVQTGAVRVPVGQLVAEQELRGGAGVRGSAVRFIEAEVDALVLRLRQREEAILQARQAKQPVLVSADAWERSLAMVADSPWLRKALIKARARQLEGMRA